jgi:hypothetical protein
LAICSRRFRRDVVAAGRKQTPRQQQIDLDIGPVEPDRVAFRHDALATRLVDDGAQLAQARAQGAARIIGDIP